MYDDIFLTCSSVQILKYTFLSHFAAEKRKLKQEGDTADTPGEDAGKADKSPKDDEKVSETKDANPEITKAREFENLARLCLKEGK